ncbi:MAG: flagellar brake protein [Fimbriimonadaceae bacterium]
MAAAGAVAGLGYWATSTQRPRGTSLTLPEGQRIRLLTPHGTYHCRVLSGTGAGLTVSAPLSGNAHVPLRPGTHVVVQAPTTTGVLSFASTVCDRRSGPASLVLRAPTKLKVVERRESRRFRAIAGEHGSIDGETALILDCATMGVCLLCRNRPANGELVVLGLPSLARPRMGWVLDTSPDTWDGRAAFRARIRLAEPLTHLPR